MSQTIQRLLRDEKGQDIAEYAVMLAVILVIVVAPFALSAQTRTPFFHKLPVRSSDRLASRLFVSGRRLGV